MPGSSAHAAGIREHDIIIAANGKNITEKETLEDILDGCNVGDNLKLKILRQGKELNMEIKLQDRAMFN